MPGWDPLLEGAPAELARAAVSDLARALATPPARGERATLGDGHAGIALFHDYVARSGGRAGAVQLFVDAAADEIAEATIGPGLYFGVTGVAWVLELVAASDQDPTSATAYEDTNDEIDELLVRHLATAAPCDGAFDWMSGLAGVGAYLLERDPERRSVARYGIERIVSLLAQCAVHDGNGATWHTAAGLLDPGTRARYPSGYANLGFAHGAAGVIAFLAGACRAGVARAQAGALLDQAVPWLLAWRRSPGAIGEFPALIDDRAAPPPSGPARVAWCHGAPGVALAVLHAATALDREAWRATAIDIACGAARHAFDELDVVDAGLCHGAAGLAHIFHRLFRCTGAAPLHAAARRWIERTLELATPGHGIVGYRAWISDGIDGPRWSDERGLLVGAAGIGLVLESAVSSIEPTWDRLFVGRF
jgi:lantibiotic biosynthesis protein